ncbi:MAG: ArsR family transcriptional regulator, partial [Desulfobacterales bacterium]|nr:ArsR family transcriptional regulator [Desulfobacterales bacterium]
MELDTFLASPRWEILQVIIKEPSSPMEIAEKIDVTISFVSQQLKLLEAANLVKKTRIKNTVKGKPRLIFSINHESCYMIPLAKGFQKKKLINMSEERKALVHIWGLEDESASQLMEEFFFRIRKYLSKIDAIAVYTKSGKLKVYFTSTHKNLTHEINEAQNKLDEKLDISLATPSSLSKLENEFLVPIYDPKGYLLSLEKELKGGLKV